MINPNELRGSQVMLNEMVKNKIIFNTILKWLLCLSVLGFVIHFPDTIGIAFCGWCILFMRRLALYLNIF
jgi:hypothetical protein